MIFLGEGGGGLQFQNNLAQDNVSNSSWTFNVLLHKLILQYMGLKYNNWTK